MGGMNRSTPALPSAPSRRALPGLSPVVAGTACCAVSALGYTGANICMRQLAALHADETWVICNKELVTVVLVGPWLLYRAFCRLPILPPKRLLAILVLVGLTVQLGANLGVQWALGIVGLAVTIPAIFGVMLTASAVLGRVFLLEPVSQRSATAIGLLLASLVLLGLAAGVAAERKDGSAGQSALDEPGLLLVILAVGAACLAGAVYAVLTTTIRHLVTQATPPSTVVFVTTLMGVLSMAPLSVYRLGTQSLLQTPPKQVAWMIAAGMLNLIAFLAITKGLQLVTVIHANVLNASQVAMAALAGMLLFREPLTAWLIAGVVATIVGIAMFDRPEDGDRDADQHA